MEKLSVLIFSRNDVRKAIDLIKDVYGVADEIVLVDSSDMAQRKELLADKRRLGLGKLRIFHAVALGYPDPLRAYALKKCRHPWVLLIDTDERISEGLKRNIKGLINSTKCSAFAIKRYEYVRQGKIKNFFTWNIRLYRKADVSYRGILHEQPMVRGVLEKMERSCYLVHMQELMTEEARVEYVQMLKFGRMSYDDLNASLVDYLSKLIMPKRRSLEGSRSGRALRSLLLAYEMLTLKKPGQELSRMDYFIHRFMIDATIQIKKGDLRGFLKQIPREIRFTRSIEKWKREPDSDEIFEISKVIGRIGIIRYLDLDKEGTVERLNRKYAGKPQGVSLLTRLLKERYERKGG
jgi:hypothetical protein